MNIENGRRYNIKVKTFLTTALIGVKVSWPLATVHGKPADWYVEQGKIINIKWQKVGENK